MTGDREKIAELEELLLHVNNLFEGYRNEFQTRSKDEYLFRENLATLLGIQTGKEGWWDSTYQEQKIIILGGIKELEARNKVMREALLPLAKIGEFLKGRLPPDTGLWSENCNFREPVRLLLSDAINANEALAAT